MIPLPNERIERREGDEMRSRHRPIDVEIEEAAAQGKKPFVEHARPLVIADENGVVVVPQRVETEAIRRAWNKVHAENVTRDAIRAGMKATAAYQRYGIL